MSNKNPSILDMLSSLTNSLTSSLSSLPDSSAVRPPSSSFSLLSTKNELFLSYLQNLTFLIILNLRNFSSTQTRLSTGNDNVPNRQTVSKATAEEGAKSNSSGSDLRDAVVENLVGLRVYLEKGVRPLEGRLKYQLDKLLLAAADHAREKSANNHQSNSRDQNPDSSADEHKEDDSNARLASSIPPLAHRPNPSALVRPSSSAHPTTSTTSTTNTKTSAPYRPPRINPTLPPPTDSSTSKRPPRRFRAMDAFIREEMGDAPVPEMSIGAGAGMGRGDVGVADTGSKEAEKARERKEWEETRLARLPGEKTKKRRRGAGVGGAEDIMAGMDWGLMNDNNDRDRRGESRERKRHKNNAAKMKSKGNGGRRSRGRK